MSKLLLSSALVISSSFPRGVERTNEQAYGKCARTEEEEERTSATNSESDDSTHSISPPMLSAPPPVSLFGDLPQCYSPASPPSGATLATEACTYARLPGLRSIALFLPLVTSFFMAWANEQRRRSFVPANPCGESPLLLPSC